MSEVRARAYPEAVHDVVSQIVEQFHPLKVILFGSYASGEPTEDSDLDLLVVMDTQDNPLRAGAIISASIAHPLPLDILVMTPTRLAAAIDRGSVFATEIATCGKVLYEA